MAAEIHTVKHAHLANSAVFERLDEKSSDLECLAQIDRTFTRCMKLPI